MDQQLSDIKRALERVEEVEELVKENVHQAMMHRHLSHVKHELRRQLAIHTTEELSVLKGTLQQEV